MNDKRRECEVLDKQNSKPKYRVFTIFVLKKTIFEQTVLEHLF